MDEGLVKRVEALEQEIARLKAQVALSQPVPSPPATPAAPPITAPPAKAGWRPGSATINQADLENRIGGKWLAIAGITLLVVAMIFFFDLAIQRGWIGLAAQIILGAVFGLLLWAGGIYMAAKHKLTGFAQVVSAGGVAIAAFAIFVAHHVDVYQQATGISLLVDSMLLGLLGIGAAFDAGYRHVPVQAGTATGLVGWTAIAGLDATGFSLAYTVFMVAALLAVGLWRGWPWMAATAAPMAITVFAWHLIDGTDARGVFASIVIVHALILGAAVRGRSVDAGTIVGHILAWLGFWIIGGLALRNLQPDNSFAYWSLAVAAIGFTASALLKTRELRIAAVVPAALAAVVGPFFLMQEAWRIPLWLLMFAGSEVMLRRNRWTTALTLRPVLLVVMWIEAMEGPIAAIDGREARWVLDLVVVLLVSAAAGVGWHGQRKETWPLPALNLAIGAIVLLAALAALLGGVVISVSWALVAVGLLVAGFMLAEPHLRIAGLTTFAIVLLRIVAIDLDGVDAIYRVLAFMGIAAMLLLGSWMYVRNASKT